MCKDSQKYEKKEKGRDTGFRCHDPSLWFFCRRRPTGIDSHPRKCRLIVMTANSNL